MQIFTDNLSAARVLSPALLIEAELEALDISKARAAVAFGLTSQQLERLLAGELPITPQIAQALEEFGSTEAAIWLRLQQSYDTHPKRGGSRQGAGRKREHLKSKQVRITASPEVMQRIESWLGQQHNAARALADLINQQVKT
jgi:addiction module HigA family antidote